MLTIEFFNSEEEVMLGELFDSVLFPETTAPDDESGDSYIVNRWGIEILSAGGYYNVDGFRWTVKEELYELCYMFDGTIQTLLCSPDHVLLTRNNGWQKLRDVDITDQILTPLGRTNIISIKETARKERLCDVQVAIAHSYFTNNVLSHNSHFLVQLGANALKLGKNVIHYTFELSETLTGMRYDSNLCDISVNDLIESKELVLQKYKENKYGRLIIKSYPANTCTIHTMRSHVEKLALKGFVPDLIIIDYADIMRSSRQYDSLRHELKLIYEELRSYADELKIPIWTASQINRDSSQNDVVGLESMSESYGKAMVADVVISLSRKSSEKYHGWGRLHIAKNRAGKDGLVYSFKIDTARSMFTFMGDVSSPEEAAQEEESYTRKTIRDKLKELSAEGKVKLDDLAKN